MSTVLSLFAGGGGFDLGAHMAGLEIAASIELNPHAAQTLRNNFDHLVLEQDATTVDYSQWRGVDLIMGGPPCQGHSIANSLRRSSTDPRNELVWEMVRAARETGARTVLIENVPTFDKPLLEKVLITLAHMGYFVGYKIFNAADYGVPSTRRRLFILASKRLLEWPNPTHRGNWQTIDMALENLWDDMDRSELPQWLKPRAKPTYRLMDAQNTNKGSERVESSRQGRSGNQPYFTLTRSCYYVRWQRKGETGKLGIAGSKRLSSFPDDFQFVGTKDRVGLQIGNAVPPLLAYNMLRGLA